MDLLMLRAFQSQILLQCDFIKLSADHVNAGLQQKEPRLIFYGLQNMLTAAANISKALWGMKDGKYAERKDLRESIEVDDTSPLHTVTMRNNFEHFDDRLEKWSKQSKRHNMCDLMVMPISHIAGIEDIDRFRFYDPESTALIFWGQGFNITELAKEINRIRPIVEREAKKPLAKEQENGGSRRLVP